MNVSKDVLGQWERPGAGDVPAARELVTLGLDRLGIVGEPGEEAAVMVSELVTNAIQHGQAPVQLQLWDCPLGCVVEVRDAEPRCPVLPSPVAWADIDLMAERGRGLPMVTAFSEGCCGVVRLVGGKSCWFALPRDGVPASPLALGAFVQVHAQTSRENALP